MLDAVVLDALAEAARAGEDHLARRALAKADPVVAWWLRRRVATAIRWASSCAADPSDRGHILRLAFLREAGALGEVAFEDRAAVTAAFDAAVAKAGPVPRVWTASIVLLGIAVATALGVGVHAWRTARFDPTSAPIGRALGPDLTDHVVRTSHARALQREARDPGAPQTAPGDLPPTVSHLSTSLAGPLSDVFGAYRTAALGPQCITAGCFDALTASIQRLDGALHTAREPYFVDSTSLSDGEPILMSYYVARERTANVGDSEVRLLRVQRLDQLDKTLPVLGYTSPHLGAGLVTLDTIERDLVQVVMPALAEGGVARLVDEASRDDGAPWAQDVEHRAGEALRRDYASYQSPALDRVIALLALREQLYWELAAAAARAGASLVRPRRLATADPLDALEGLVAPSSLRGWRETNASLDEAPAREAFDFALDRLAERVERHELEHQIDYRAGLVTLPADLGTLLGVTDVVVAPGGAAARCRDELSAELASIATDPSLATTMLVLSLGAVFDRGQWSTPYAYAGAVLLDAIARELGVSPGDAQRIDLKRDRSAAVFTAVVARPGKDIADAASRAYARLFAVPLPAATLGPARTYPVWRR